MSARTEGSSSTLSWILPLVVVVGLLVPTLCAADGDGLVLPWGLWVAGDLTVAGEVPKGGPAKGEIDDVSLLARWEPTPRLALFGEFRFEDLIEVVDGEGADVSNGAFVIERLYAEALLTPTLTLRVGEVFTPFGLWNQTHRAPFTWTVNEPAITDDVFPTHATGLSLIHRTTWSGWSFDSTLYGPMQDALAFRATNERGWMVGARSAVGRAVGSGFGSLGVNLAGFRPRNRSEWNTATGIDLDLSLGMHQVTGEQTFRVPEAGGPVVHGLYLQDAIPLERLTPWARDLYGVVRFEYFQPSHGAAAVGGLAGVFWRPLPNLILRADYLFASRTLERLQPGLHGSISLLF